VELIRYLQNIVYKTVFLWF